MGSRRVRPVAPPPLIGRGAELETIGELARARPGVLAIAGPPGVGATRLAREAAAWLAADGHALVLADGQEGAPEQRLSTALRAQGLLPDPERAARIRPLVAVMGDCEPDSELLGRLANRLSGTRALLLFCTSAPPDETAALALGPLPEDAAVTLALAAEPELADRTAEHLARLGGGLPGHIIPLARAARDWSRDRPFIAVPHEVAAAIDGPLRALPPPALDVARWAAVVGTTVGAGEIARLVDRTAAATAPLLDGLADAGVLEEADEPGEPAWRFRDALVRELLVQEMGGAERRRRFAAALRTGVGLKLHPSELVRRAIGARDPEPVVRLAVRAAERERRDGRLEEALELAETGLAWWSPAIAPALRCSALRERGVALSDLTRWNEAIAALGEAAEGFAELGDEDELLGTASAESTAHWMLGQHEEALDALTRHLSLEGDPPEPTLARADALTQATGIAVATSRFRRGADLARRARAESISAGDPENAARALIFLGTSEVGSSGAPHGLVSLDRARAEAGGGGGSRNETLAMIHQSHVLLLLGHPAEAEGTAREGVARAAELGLPDHRLVLEGNLGDAIAAQGRLEEARGHLQRAAAGWVELSRDAPSPADPGIAWLELAEGRIGEATERYRALLRDQDDHPLLEMTAPVAAGHALAETTAGHNAAAARIVAGQVGLWRRTDDRLAIVPVLAAGAELEDVGVAEECREILAGLGAGGAPLAAALRRFADGQAARGEDADAAREHLLEAEAALDAIGMRWWAARALFGAGLTRPEGGSADELLRARARFREMGAEGWQLRVEAELRARGHRIPSRADGRPERPGELSARELEVLDQLAEGLTNREIGDHLFISERTVARHVGKILAKLEVGNRTAAVRAGRQQGLISTERR